MLLKVHWSEEFMQIFLSSSGQDLTACSRSIWVTVILIRPLVAGLAFLRVHQVDTVHINIQVSDY